MNRIVVGVTGASGAILAVRLLEKLNEMSVETHLVISKWGQQTLVHETSYTVDNVRKLATKSYAPGDMGAAISSGSFFTDGMVVIPCSMRSLAAIARGAGDNLVHRAADVTLKERRKLVLAARETPLNEIHLENMLKLHRMGCAIVPPMPSFYNHPSTIDDMVDYMVLRILDQLDLVTESNRRWAGKMKHQDKVTVVNKIKD